MDKLTKASFTDADGRERKGWLFLWRGYEMIMSTHAKGWSVFEPNTGRRITRMQDGYSPNKTKRAAYDQCLTILKLIGESTLRESIHQYCIDSVANRYIRFHKMEIPDDVQI